MRSELRRFAVVGMLFGSLLADSGGCSHKASKDRSPVGQLRLALTGTSNSGARYRLREGRFQVTGRSEASAWTEDNPNADAITLQLPIGDYQIELLSGWYLEKATPEGDYSEVKAELTSDNPVAFAIASQQTTVVQFRFKAGNDVVPIGDGNLTITIAVDDSNGGGGGSATTGGTGGMGAAGDSGTGGSSSCAEVAHPASWKQIATLVQPGDYGIASIQAIHRLNADPSVLLVSSQSVNAYCGGGAPAAIWRLMLDPASGLATSINRQTLNQIQNVRDVIFESSDGTLFTGGGWCGFKPPYYSVDHGITWAPAIAGSVYPQNSAFSYVEFQNQVYVGTGYDPYDGIVYRWLGGGNWAQVLDVPHPRTIVGSMASYQDHLFVAPGIYGAGECSSSVPAYISDDGVSFRTTTGIPSCDSILNFLQVGGQLIAITKDQLSNQHAYRWDASQSWALVSSIPETNGLSRTFATAYGDTAFAVGTFGTGTRGVYETQDFVSWRLLAADVNPPIYTITVEGHLLYAGDNPGNGAGHVYAIDLCPPH